MKRFGPFADTGDGAVAEAAIPGVGGAPVRTPVRAGGVQAGAALWPAILGRLATRQLWIELYGLPGYAQTLKAGALKGGAPTAAGVQPRDPRPIDPAVGKGVLAGRFTLAGLTLETPRGGDPWDRPSPSRAFAADLHAFAWLPSLMAQDKAAGADRGAVESLRLTLAWGDHFARWSPFAWAPEILSRRVINLSAATRRMAQAAGEAERLRLLDLLARQGRQLLRPPGGLAGRAQRACAAALAGLAVAGPAGARLRRGGLARLPAALNQTVMADGGHASRSPEAGLELLLDLMMLEDGLAQASEPAPDGMRAAMDRLAGALGALVLPDGRLAAFQGGGASTPARVRAARDPETEGRLAPAPSDRDGDGVASDAPSGEGAARPAGGTVGGLIRIASPMVTVIADVAAPAEGAWAAAACAQPLALEICCGKDRMITGCGWTPRAGDRQALRLTPAHSTLTLGEASLAEPLSGWKGELLDARLVGRAPHVSVDERLGEGAVWLEMEHDGWVGRFGLVHQRRLYLDQRLDELRAEERLHPVEGQAGGAPARAIAAPYAVRFHLEPGVQATPGRDRRTLLLRGASGRGWWFRSDAPDVAIEASVHVDDGLTRRSLQIVARGSARTNAETRIRWKLSPAGASGDGGPG